MLIMCNQQSAPRATQRSIPHCPGPTCTREESTACTTYQYSTERISVQHTPIALCGCTKLYLYSPMGQPLTGHPPVIDQFQRVSRRRIGHREGLYASERVNGPIDRFGLEVYSALSWFGGAKVTNNHNGLHNWNYRLGGIQKIVRPEHMNN